MMNKPSLTPEMVEMKARGLTYSEIASICGVSRQCVQEKFKPRAKILKVIAARSNGNCERCGQLDRFGHYHHKVYDFSILNEPENLIYLCCGCHRKEVLLDIPRGIELVVAVEKERMRMGLRNGEFASFLGVAGSEWSRIQRGEIPAGVKFLSVITQKMPELGLAVTDYMRSDDPEKVV